MRGELSQLIAVGTRVKPAALALLSRYYKGQGGVRSSSEVVSRAVEDLAKVLEESGLALPVSGEEVEREIQWLKGESVRGRHPKVQTHTVKRLFQGSGRAMERLAKEAE
jgi:hypothetical protein